MIYNRRHPERTDYYRIIEANFEEFERQYPDLFEDDYGDLRKEVMQGIYAYLEYGIPENGVARVKCECGEDIFVAFSCKERMVVPVVLQKHPSSLARRSEKSSNRFLIFISPLRFLKS